MLAYHLSLFLVFIIAQNIIYYSLTCNGANDKDCVTCNASAHRYEDFGPHDKKCLCLMDIMMMIAMKNVLHAIQLGKINFN